jgi:hypothetical protein
VDSVRVITVYVPLSNALPTDSAQFKLLFFFFCDSLEIDIMVKEEEIECCSTGMFL